MLISCVAVRLFGCWSVTCYVRVCYIWCVLHVTWLVVVVVVVVYYYYCYYHFHIRLQQIRPVHTRPDQTRLDKLTELN